MAYIATGSGEVVRVKVNVKFALEQTTRAQRGE